MDSAVGSSVSKTLLHAKEQASVQVAYAMLCATLAVHGGEGKVTVRSSGFNVCSGFG